MKQLFTLLLLCVSLSSCQKKYTDPSSFIYCKFSLYSTDNKIKRVYYLRDGVLYNHTPNDQGVMNNDQYLKAEKVMNEIPTEITRNPDVMYTCSCPSFEKIILEYKLDNRVYAWQIDVGANNPPRKVQLFTEKVYKLIEELEP